MRRQPRDWIVAGCFLAFVFCTTPAQSQTSDDLFNDQLLQDVRLYMHPGDWTTLKKNYGSNDYYPADLEWKFQGQRIELPAIWIRSRGAGSRSDVKPGLRVDVDRDEPGRRFLGLRSFQLRNHTQDASMVHDPVAMVFFRRFGIPAPRESHTRLYVNDEYIGLYTIVESIDKSFLSRVYGENDGYLYQYDDTFRIPYYFEYKGPDPALYSPNPFKPITHEKDPDPRPIEAMIRAINQSSDADFVKAVSEYLDLNEFMALVAIERFLTEQDGVIGAIGMNNFFMYRFEKKNLSQLIAWDKDLALVGSPGESIWRFVTDVPQDQQNRLMRRALNVPELKAVYLSTLARCATTAGGTGGFFLREIEREYAHIRQAALEDPNKQCLSPQGEYGPCSNAAFEGAIESLRDLARNRSRAVLKQVAEHTAAESERSFTIQGGGGLSWTTMGVSEAADVGYARVQALAASPPAAGMAIFGYRQDNVLVTEAGVPLTQKIRAGRLYAEVEGPVNTGLAIANTNDESVVLSFYFTDLNGKDYGQGSTTLQPRSQIARFLNESPFRGTLPLHGSFSFNSTLPVAALALRAYTNERSETLVTTLPVVEIAAPSQDVTILPHFADGGGWTTQIVLLNTTDAEQTGIVQFVGPGSTGTPGAPVEVSIDGSKASSFPYTLPGRSARLLVTDGKTEQIGSGSVRIVPAAGSSSPAASSVFAYRRSGITVTAAGVPAVPAGKSFRVYAEAFGSSGEVGFIESGLALANPGTDTLAVNLELTDLSGRTAGSATTVSIPPRGQIARFLSQFSGLGTIKTPFQGILRISTTSQSGVAVIGLRGRLNERGDYLITTTPPFPDQAADSSAADAVFPHWVDGGGYATQFVLLGARAGSASVGTFQTLSQGGGPLRLALW